MLALPHHNVPRFPPTVTAPHTNSLGHPTKKSFYLPCIIREPLPTFFGPLFLFLIGPLLRPSTILILPIDLPADGHPQIRPIS